MFETIGAIFAAGVVAQVMFWIAVGLLFPVFWLWMIIDAALRPEPEYPSKTTSEKIVWIVAMAFVQVAAIAYFFFVYRAVRRAPVAPQAPMAPSPTA